MTHLSRQLQRSVALAAVQFSRTKDAGSKTNPQTRVMLFEVSTARFFF